METMLTFNPFKEYGITTYEQYKKYPFLVFGSSKLLISDLEQQVKHIQSNYFFSDRIILLGERGIGKTSSLFFAKDILEKAGINVRLFSRLIEDVDHYNRLVSSNVGVEKNYFIEDTKNPLYILIDFPDTIEKNSFKKFLEFLWELLIHKNGNQISFVFAMNRSHYDKSFSFSEIFGKFLTLRMDRLDFEEVNKLIDSRLQIINLKLENVFEEKAIKTIFSYSKGIPRNTISACSLLLSQASLENPMTQVSTELILKEEYISQVINDRVDDPSLKKIYKEITSILQESFEGLANSREEFNKVVMERCKIGRNSVIQMTRDLIKFGILTEYRGGEFRTNKILSFN